MEKKGGSKEMVGAWGKVWFSGFGEKKKKKKDNEMGEGFKIK